METIFTDLYCGETAITLAKHTFGLAGASKEASRIPKHVQQLFFLKLHDDEQTAKKAAFNYLEAKGSGCLLEVLNNECRCITFNYLGNDYVFDPNRIYSHAGIATTLSEYNIGITLEAIIVATEPISLFADSLLQQLPLTTSTYLVSIHNNTDGEYSVESYINSSDAASLFVNPEHDIDNFFFTTTQSSYNYFKQLRFNTVLQANDTVLEDGSLSVYCAKQGIPYINVESEHGQVLQQIQMLKAVNSYLFPQPLDYSGEGFQINTDFDDNEDDGNEDGRDNVPNKYNR